jgi:hypothetical protein
MTDKIKKQLLADYRHFIIRYPKDEESRIIHIMCMENYKDLTEEEIVNVVYGAL